MDMESKSWNLSTAITSIVSPFYWQQLPRTLLDYASRKSIFGTSCSNQPINNCHAMRLAFGLDQIRETIFANLSVADLKKCRQVCHEWKRSASRELRKRVVITFNSMYKPHKYYFHAHNSTVSKATFRRDRAHTPRPPRLLQQLTALIDQTTPNSFPSNHFEFLETKLPPTPDLQDFLTLHGYHVKAMTMSLNYYCDARLNVIAMLEELRQLLVQQTPNLHTLKLRIKFCFTLARRETKSDWAESPGTTDNLNSKHLKLKVLDLHTDLPPTVFKWICTVFPNLEEIQLFHRNLPLLRPPFHNRLHLLKQLCFAPNASNTHLLKTILEQSDLNHKGGLQLRELSFSFGWTFQNPESWPLITDLLHKILRGSSSSLKKIRWSRMGFLCGVELPTLCNVHTLEIGYDHLSTFRKIPLFPPGFKLKETFPALTTVRLCKDCINFKASAESYSDFLSIFFVSVQEYPEESLRAIQNVYVEGADDYPATFFQTCSQWFPNATI